MSSRWFAACIAAVVIVTAIAYAPALRGPQLFDDPQAIQGNATLTSLRHALVPPPATPVTGRPVVNVTFAFNYWLNDVLGIDQRPDPQGVYKTVSYHVVNVAIHIACGLLLIGIIRRTLRSGRVPERWQRNADIVAIGVAALWLLHPLQTEPVDYIVQRTELLVALFYLGTLYCAIRAWDAGARWYFIGVIACLLGMGSKEVMVSAPIMIVLYDRAFRLDAWRDLLAPRLRARRLFYGALAATWAFLIALMVMTPRGSSIGFHSGVPWYEYLHSQGWAIAHYLRLVIVPVGLTLDYGFRVVPHWQGVPGLLLLTALALLTIVAWTRANRWGWAAFLGSWFFLILAPSSSIVPILTEVIAERRMYLPLAAVILALVVAGDFAFQRLRAATLQWKSGGTHRTDLRLAVALIAIVLVILLDGLTLHRSAIYRDPEAIWRDALAHVPANPRAWNNLGVLVANQPAPQPAAAESLYAEAVALDSSYIDALVNVGMSEYGHGNLAEAERHFRRVLLLDSTNHFGLGGLGGILLARGDTNAAVPYMERFALGGAGTDYYTTLGRVLVAKGLIADAVDQFERAVQSAPERTDLMVYLAGMLIEQQLPDQAEPYLVEATRRDPDSGVDLALLSLARADLGHSAEAVQDAAEAVQEAGSDERVYYYAGRAMIDDHRADLAYPYLKRAVALGPTDADALTQLGEAESALGDHADAIVSFERALRIDPADSAARVGLSRLR